MKLAGALLAAVALAGCGGSSAATSSTHAPASAAPAVARIEVSSPAFAGGGRIPPRFTCQGQDISPPLRWSGVPDAARELDLVMRDPDAPGGNFLHWRLTGIPPSTRNLPAGQTPAGARAERNDFGRLGYGGPCPPAGAAHHYVITVTARSGAAVVAVGSLVGTYARR